MPSAASPSHSESHRKPKQKKKAAPLPEPITDPVESAQAAGLRYVSDIQPGFRRRRNAQGFRYTTSDGKPLRDPAALARIKSLVIPPAWTSVWIATSANGHLQATGRDAKGRKQSRYHPRWRQIRDETKYERMILFAEALPVIRKRVLEDIALPGLPREKILGTIISLMEATHIRVGNAEYARENHSYGLTTMRNRHVEVNGSNITFTFQGKSRVSHTINLQDRRLAGIIRHCADIPGYQLFQYLEPDGTHHAIDSADVNDYLHTITGQHFTAKDFRTWAGSVLACHLLCEFEPFSTETQAKKNVVQAIAAVAARLGNTPSVCRKCYIHPAVLAQYLAGNHTQAALAAGRAKRTALRPEEHLLLLLLENRAAV